MIEANRILADVELEPELAQSSPLFSPGLGFAYIRCVGGPEGNFMSLLGFTGNRSVPFTVPGREGQIWSITDFANLPPEEKSIKMQSRGVGTRMYNTPQACLGTGEGSDIKAYVFDIDVDKIVDRRRYSDGTYRGRVIQAAQQAGRLLKTKAIGLEAVVKGIHESFGDPNEVDAVLYNQSATMELEQKREGVKQSSGISPEFMVIRNPHIAMHEVGTYRP